MDLQSQTVAKLVLLGEMGSGKSSLVLRYVKGQFFDYQVCAGLKAHAKPLLNLLSLHTGFLCVSVYVLLFVPTLEFQCIDIQGFSCFAALCRRRL